jgi:DNA-binding FadR family transcriptional regulator
MPQKREAIVERVIERVVDGVLEPGEALPREADLAREFGVSRGVAREAIRALQERGLVTVRHGLGQTVNDPQDWRVLHPDVLRALLTSDDAPALLADLLECRLIAEVEAAGLAAERATDSDVAALADRFAALSVTTAGSRPSDRGAAAAAEREFHMQILWVARNRPLAQMLEPVHDAFAQARDALPTRKAAREERRRIVDAIGARDAGSARGAMRVHLEGVARSLRRRR